LINPQGLEQINRKQKEFAGEVKYSNNNNDDDGGNNNHHHHMPARPPGFFKQKVFKQGSEIRHSFGDSRKGPFTH